MFLPINLKLFILPWYLALLLNLLIVIIYILHCSFIFCLSTIHKIYLKLKNFLFVAKKKDYEKYVKKNLSNYFIDDLSNIISQYCEPLIQLKASSEFKIPNEILNQIRLLYFHNHNDKIYHNKISFVSHMCQNTLTITEYDILKHEINKINFNKYNFLNSYNLSKNIVIKNNNNIYIIFENFILEIDSLNYINIIKMGYTKHIELYSCIKNINNNVIYTENNNNCLITYNNELTDKYDVFIFDIYVSDITERLNLSTKYYYIFSRRISYELFSNDKELLCCVKLLSDEAIFHIFNYNNLSYAKEEYKIILEQDYYFLCDLIILFFNSSEIVFLLKRKYASDSSNCFYIIDRLTGKTQEIFLSDADYYLATDQSVIRLFSEKCTEYIRY